MISGVTYSSLPPHQENINKLYASKRCGNIPTNFTTPTKNGCGLEKRL